MNASILKKVAMALTGLLWIGFTIGHLSGNYLLLKGPEAFNGYAAFLAKTGTVLYLVEAGLVFLLLLHVVSAVRVTLENRDARPVPYSVHANAGESTFASRTMAIGGIILAVFIVTHVAMFKFGDWSGSGGLWGLVIRSFKNPLLVGWYTVAMLALGLHLSHGLGSAFQSLGALKRDWRPKLGRLGALVGWIIALGFIFLPIWSLLLAKV